MNNFKTILSAAVLVAMSGTAVQATDIAVTGAVGTDAATITVAPGLLAGYSVNNLTTNTNLVSGATSVIGVLGDDTASAITLGATARSFVVSFSSTGTNASQSLTQVHDAAGIASVVAASGFQAASNTNAAPITATGTMENMTLVAPLQDSMIYSVSATGAAASQSVSPDHL